MKKAIEDILKVVRQLPTMSLNDYFKSALAASCPVTETYSKFSHRYTYLTID